MVSFASRSVLACLLALPASAWAQTYVEVTSGATASTNDGNLPANAVDADLGTRWSGSMDGAWLQLDLGVARTIGFVKVAVYQGNARHNIFDIQVLNGSTWTTVHSATSSGTTTALETYDFTDVDARFVRYLGHGATLNAGGTSTWNSVSEMEVFAVVPTPTATPLPAITPTPTSTSPPSATPTPTPGLVKLSATATASTDDGNVPANTLDGSLTTRWSGNGDGAWIQYDLGTTNTVGLVKIAVYNGNSRQNRLDLQVSGTSSGPWTTLLANVSTSGTTTQLETFDIPDSAARFVRYVGHMSNVGTFNSVTEVEVWGAACPTCTPPPTPTPTATSIAPTPTPTPTATPTSTFLVSSISELQSRINSAAPGHQIVLRNGTYSTSGSISVNGRNGTASSRIVIRAESTGGVTIGGSAGFSFSGSSYVTVQGFRFTHGSTQNLAGGNHHLRLTRNVFQLASGASHWVQVSADDTEIDHNTFQNKTSAGVYCTVRGTSAAMAQRTWVHHNYFSNHSFTGSNGGEGVQIGLSGLSLLSANAIIEYNLFDRHNGDWEAISVKSSDNTVRYNTVQNGKACIVLRHGNRSTVAGNFVLNNGCGIRFYGNDHKIYNNYIEGTTSDPPPSLGWAAAITVGSGSVQDHLASDSAESRKGQDAPDRVRVTFNTLVNNFRNIAGEDRAFVPRACVIANNIVRGDNGTLVILSADPPVNFSWEGNILWGTAANGNIPTSGFRRVDPLLMSVSGLYHLGAGSPAVDTGVGSYPEVVADMDGQTRDGARDVGADESTTDAVTRRPLTTADVGPNAP